MQTQSTNSLCRQLTTISTRRLLYSMTRDGNHDTCIPRRYSLYVVDNYHLEELWRNIKQVSILNGRAYFHLNAHLCHEKIMLVEEQLKVTATMPTTDRLLTITDASQNSNGERAICKFYFILQYFNVVRCVVLCIEYSVLCIVYCVLCVVCCILLCCVLLSGNFSNDDGCSLHTH